MDDAFRLEHLLVGAQVQDFTIGDDAVEVEDDRLKRAQARPLSRIAGRMGHGVATVALVARSPARIGTSRRFSFGGYGQSNSGL